MADPLHVPPKGYSIPRAPPSDASKHCQKCNSGTHWTYECPARDAAGTSSGGGAIAVPKLSKTQMLKLGLQKPLRAEAPPKSEREMYDENVKLAREALMQEGEEEKKLRKRARSPGSDAKPDSDPPAASNERVHALDQL